MDDPLMVALPRTCERCGAHNYHYGYCSCGWYFRGFVAPQFAMSWERMVLLAAMNEAMWQATHDKPERGWSRADAVLARNYKACCNSLKATVAEEQK